MCRYAEVPGKQQQRNTSGRNRQCQHFVIGSGWNSEVDAFGSSKGIVYGEAQIAEFAAAQLQLAFHHGEPLQLLARFPAGERTGYGQAPDAPIGIAGTGFGGDSLAARLSCMP